MNIRSQYGARVNAMKLQHEAELENITNEREDRIQQHLKVIDRRAALLAVHGGHAEEEAPSMFSWFLTPGWWSRAAQ